MAEPRPQSFENHTRYDPVFHYFLGPLSIASFVAAVWRAIANPSFATMLAAVGALLFLVAVFLIRIYALKVQNRLIRLEERLRLSALLPESQRARILELTEGQLIALRFASDAELPALAAKAWQEKMAAKEIKQAIRAWRPDNYRI